MNLHFESFSSSFSSSSSIWSSPGQIDYDDQKQLGSSSSSNSSSSSICPIDSDDQKQTRFPNGVRQLEAFQGSADLQSAVSQICNLHAVDQIGGLGFASDMPSATRRYGRLQICATKKGRIHRPNAFAQ